MHFTSRRIRLVTCGVGLLALTTAQSANAGQEQFTSGDLTYVTQNRVMPKGKVTTARAACPEGTRLTGGGSGVFGESVTPFESLSAAIPVDTAADLDTDRDDAFRSVVRNVSKSQRTLGNTAICLEAGSAGLTYPVVQQEIQGGADIGDEVACQPETALVGGGAGWSGSPGTNEFVRAPNLAIRASRPVEQMWAAAGNIQSNAGTRTLTLSAVCLATGLGTVELKTAEKQVGNKGGTVKASCSPGYRVTGGGGVGGGAIQSQPYDSGDAGKAPDDGWKVRVATNPQQAEPQQVTASTLCFQPAI